MPSAIDPTKPAQISLPIISLTDPSPATAQRTLQAAITYGFLYISPSSTPLAPTLINSLFSLSQQFFTTTPTAGKLSYNITTQNKGYFAPRNESLDPAKHPGGDLKEGFNIGEFNEKTNPPRPDQPLPAVLESQLEHLHAFEAACRQTMNSILDLLSTALSLPDPQFFSARHGKPSSCTLRLLHYPAVEAGGYDGVKDIRAGAHSDYGSLTLLFQQLGQPGLEIRPPPKAIDDAGEEEWQAVPVVPDGYDLEANGGVPPILVNLGDLFSYWTRGLLRSTVHRVVFPSPVTNGQVNGAAQPEDEVKGQGMKDRYSIAFFGHPADDMVLEPVDSPLVRDREEVGVDGKKIVHGVGGGMDGNDRALTAKEHLLKRLGATYADRVEKA